MYSQEQQSIFYFILQRITLCSKHTKHLWRPVTEHRPNKNTGFQYSFITQRLVASVREDLKVKHCTELKHSSCTRESHLKIVQSIFECWGMKEYGKSSHAEGWFVYKCGVSHGLWSSGDKFQIIQFSNLSA